MGIVVTLRGGSGDMHKSVYDSNLNGKIDKAQSEDNIAKYLIPSGGIILWSGAIAAIPSGFVICDGTNSTPDLTDRFVIHADSDSGGTNDVDVTGGVKDHILTINEIPPHAHGERVKHSSSAGAVGAQGCAYASDATAGVTTNIGGGLAHTNRDKFYALAYIMKI